MILDAIIGLFAALFGLLFEGVAALFVPLVNFLAAGVEAIIGLFVGGFSLARIERKRETTASTAACETTASSASAAASRMTAPAAVGVAIVLFILGAIVAFAAPKMMNRQITLVAADGHSLPYAAVIIHTSGGDEHRRTDDSGNITIPRFTTTSVTVKDPRYVEQTWRKSEIGSQLVVERTRLGAGLDVIAGHLLKPAKQ